MKSQRKFWRAASVAIFAGLLAGCGSQPTGLLQPSSTGTQALPTSRSVTIVQEQEKTGVSLRRGAPRADMHRQHDLLNLTDEQKTKMQAIIQAHKDTLEAMKAGHQAIVEAMAKPEVDQALLAKAIDTHREQAHAAVSDLVAMAGEIRDVLTDEQRAKLVDMMSKVKERREERRARREAREEKGAEMPDPLGMKESHMAMHAAFTAFIETGDRESLANAMNTIIDHMPDSVTVAARLANLTPEQRERLLALAQRVSEKAGEKETEAESCPEGNCM